MKNDESRKQRGVIFSYVDYVNEISARDFLNIIINFLETAVSLHSKLQLLIAAKHERWQQQQKTSTSATMTTPGTSAKAKDGKSPPNSVEE